MKNPLLPTILICMLLSVSCSLGIHFPVVSPRVQAIQWHGEVLKLSWDEDPLAEDYNLSYRYYESQQVFTVSKSFQEAEAVLEKEDFGNGSFEFGIQSCYSDGSCSQIYWSTDSTADPSTGWFLEWH
jgi:hypothetical protein